MADFENIPIYTTAEKIEKIANMEINIETLDKNSSDNSLPTSKTVAEAMSKFISLEDKTEWIFNGGDASGSVGVELVIDDEMSSESNNLVPNKIIKEYVDKKFLSFYPIGSIYMSMNDTSPDYLFGGEWKRIQDTFLLACSGTYPAGSTGGEAEHKLEENELPKITGKAGFRDTFTEGHDTILDGATGALSVERTTWVGEHSALNVVAQNDYKTNDLILNFGGDTPHNNMPPYLAVHMWQRTA